MAEPNGRGGWHLTDDDVAKVLAASSTPHDPTAYERYCVTSGRPVSMIPGDRCLDHGDAYAACTTDVRPAQCQHPRLSANHPTPTCAECGRAVDRG